MIYLDSRYVDGLLYKAQDSRSKKYQVSVFREFPTELANYFLYTWVETDRLDILANRFLGTPNLWWRIMDFNPDIIDPATIEPGTLLRIPNE